MRFVDRAKAIAVGVIAAIAIAMVRSWPPSSPVPTSAPAAFVAEGVPPAGVHVSSFSTKSDPLLMRSQRHLLILQLTGILLVRQSSLHATIRQRTLRARTGTCY